MNESEMTTLEAIHKAAKTEFLEKGFVSASLRNIVKTAGVTTGAFYGYYKSKEDLFAALVEEPYRLLIETFSETVSEFGKMEPKRQLENLGVFSFESIKGMLEYVYEHMSEFKLLLLCSEGTRFSGIIDEMVEIETQATHDFYQTLRTVGEPAPSIDPQLEHILITGMFNTLFELVIHEIPMERAKTYLRQMWDFYCAGWYKIMGR